MLSASTIRVSVSGAPCSGKTTLVSDLKSLLPQHTKYTPDIPRQAIEALGDTLCLRDLAAFQNYVGFAQLLAEANPPSKDAFLHDKSLIDALSYWRVLVGEPEPAWAMELSPDRYSIVLLCDWRELSLPTDDPIQKIHWHARSVIADEIEAIASRSSLSIVRVSGSRIDRLKIAFAAINSCFSQSGS